MNKSIILGQKYVTGFLIEKGADINVDLGKVKKDVYSCIARDGNFLLIYSIKYSF